MILGVETPGTFAGPVFAANFSTRSAIICPSVATDDSATERTETKERFSMFLSTKTKPINISLLEVLLNNWLVFFKLIMK